VPEFSPRWGMASRKEIEHLQLPEIDPSASAICTVDSFRPAKIDLDVDPSWLNSASIDRVTYALPQKMLDRLTLALRLQNASAVFKTETAFLGVCHAHRAVGICESKPVVYPYLTGMDTLPASTSSATAGWSADSRHALLMVEERALEVRERLKGYLGWLVTEPGFLSERDELRADWRQFPEDQAPRMPLRRIPRTIQPRAEIVAVPEALAGFLGAADAFLKKWSLAGLITWELPEPWHHNSPIHCPSTHVRSTTPLFTSSCLRTIRFRAAMACSRKSDNTSAGLRRTRVFLTRSATCHITWRMARCLKWHSGSKSSAIASNVCISSASCHCSKKELLAIWSSPSRRCKSIARRSRCAAEASGTRCRT